MKTSFCVNRNPIVAVGRRRKEFSLACSLIFWGFASASNGKLFLLLGLGGTRFQGTG